MSLWNGEWMSHAIPILLFRIVNYSGLWKPVIIVYGFGSNFCVQMFQIGILFQYVLRQDLATITQYYLLTPNTSNSNYIFIYKQRRLRFSHMEFKFVRCNMVLTESMGCNGLINRVLLRQAVDSSPPSAAFMRQWIGSALVQIMACRLFGAKPLSKPMLSYCQLEP